MISNPKTVQLESLEYLFKTTNYHVTNFREMLVTELEALVDMAIAPTVTNEQRTHYAGQAMAIKELLKKITF